uniref:C-type lectin n=1 Tax=Pristionchus pacificus TaxID=54126 RepID=A0A8R1U9M9_PRIPA
MSHAMRCLAVFVVLFGLAHALVKFDYSVVLQAADLDPFSNTVLFDCYTSCKVYVDRKSDKLLISHNGRVIADFTKIIGDSAFNPAGFEIAAGTYKLENRGEINPVFVFYIVDSEAANVNTQVYVPTETIGISFKGHDRYVTVLSSFDALEFSAFQGTFPAGYPRIYSTGFDAAGDSRCHPVYQARSQDNAEISLPRVASAVITVDFGFVGAHNVSVNQKSLDNPRKGQGASTVYMSPGYVGCSFNAGHNYYANVSEVYDYYQSFMNEFNLVAVYDSLTYNEPLQITMGGVEQALTGSSRYEVHNPSDALVPSYTVLWSRTTPSSSFAVQIEWNIDEAQPTIPTTTTRRAVQTTTTRAVPKTTPVPWQTTTFGAPSTRNPAIGDSYCSCAVDKFGMPHGWLSTEIWLDVVIVLDTSEAMGAESLEDAATLIESLIGDDDYDVLITDTRSQFYTRIGVVVMSDTAEVLFNLNMTKSDTITDKVHVAKGVTKIDVMHAFVTATDMFANGLITKPDRANTRQVIYYLTDSDAKLNATQIKDFKERGTIIVEQFAKKGENDKDLPQLASSGYYFKTNEESPIQNFCKANCFCAPDRSPYAGPWSDAAVIAGGGCFHAPTIGLQFGKAQKECSNNRGSGELASVHDKHKALFLNELVSDSTNKPYYFWIGYSKNDDGVWKWEDGSSDPYTNWDYNEPSSASVSKCAYVDQEQENLPWGAGNCQIVFPYVCEYAPCSVGNKIC